MRGVDIGNNLKNSLAFICANNNIREGLKEEF